MKKQEQTKLDLNALMVCSLKLIDEYVTIEAHKDSLDAKKTAAQQAIWKALNILGKAEIELDAEMENMQKETK